MAELIKLNLGCGQRKLDGYVNVDLYGEPDIVHNLEETPWPFADNSSTDIVLSHVLEHLGATTESYFDIIKELYRVSAPNALITIIVPHPRHDHFLGDPTHVRPITVGGIQMFSKKLNDEWAEQNAANTPLAYILDVDFELVALSYMPDPIWHAKLNNGEMDQAQFEEAARIYNNVIQEITIQLKVIK